MRVSLCQGLSLVALALINGMYWLAFIRIDRGDFNVVSVVNSVPCTPRMDMFRLSAHMLVGPGVLTFSLILHDPHVCVRVCM